MVEIIDVHNWHKCSVARDGRAAGLEGTLTESVVVGAFIVRDLLLGDSWCLTDYQRKPITELLRMPVGDGILCLLSYNRIGRRPRTQAVRARRTNKGSVQDLSGANAFFWLFVENGKISRVDKTDWA